MFKYIYLLLLLPLLLNSCGFHPRGPRALAAPLHNIYVQSNDPYGELARNIKQELRMSGVHLTPSPQEATTVLNILQENKSQELLSINSSQQTRQYNLRLSVTFEVTDTQGERLILPQTVTETRPLTLQSNQILAGSNQAAQLYRDMRDAITYNLMNRLASKNATEALIKNQNKNSEEP